MSALSKSLGEKIEKLERTLTELAKAILGVVSSSIDYCLRKFQGLTTPQKVQVVLEYFMGALGGAAAGAELRKFLGIASAGVFAAVGAVSGAATASLKAVHEATKENRDEKKK